MNEILSTSGWRTRASPVSRPPGMIDTTPSGRSISSSISANHSASRGVSGAGLTTTVQPAISAGMSFGMIRNCGTFHGTIAPTTPTGARRRCTSPNRPCRRSTHGNSRAVAMFRCICANAPVAWPSRLKLRGEPISAVIRSAISSVWPLYTAASFSIFSIRSNGISRGHGPSSNALLAAITALSTSLGAASGVSPIGFSLCGEITESRCRVDGVCHRPPM